MKIFHGGVVGAQLCVLSQHRGHLLGDLA